MQTLVRGDVSVALLSDVTLNAGLADGIPVGAVYPKSGVPATEIALFVLQKAKHPNAGKVMANWLMSLKGR